MAIRAQLQAAAEAIATDDQVRAVVIAGAGGRAFSVGSDIREFPADATAGLERARQEHACYDAIAALPQPTVAALEGLALGGGFELALACDLRVATANLRLGLPEVSLGVFPSGGGTQRLPGLIGPSLAKEHMFLGEPWGADDALRLGLVNRVVPEGTALSAAIELAMAIAERPARAVRAIKAAVDGGLRDGGQYGRLLEETLIAELFTSHDAQEGVRAFLAKRAPRFTHR
jgi:enoyl-CoA hydratase/carnithine racemase